MTQLLEVSKDAAQPVGSIRTDVATLRRAINKVAPAVERRNTIPVLSCLLFDVSGDTLRITGTDLDTIISVNVTLAAPAADCRLVIPAALLSRILRGGERGDPVEITALTESGNGLRQIRLSVGPLTVHVHEVSLADDFPVYKTDDTAASITLPATSLRAIIDNCSLCISDEETRYYLNGIYLHPVDGMLCGVATNGHQLARYTTDQAWPLASLIMHKKSLRLLRQLLPASGDVTISAHDRPGITIMGNGWSMFAKCVDGTFPDYTRVVPQHDKPGGTACLNAALFRRLPRGSERGRAAALDLAAKSITVTVPGEYDATLPIEATGEIRIGFNVNYLADMVAAWGTIRLTCGGTGDAALIHSEDPNVLGVIMPMRES